ncbi:MAG: Ni/Fe hydrogenase subunit alpha [Thermodesulfovibrionales bacterium]|nr:Ni/Fe hydrogenase subunit alpha [Thermodesulfovibrionales bacterium]
MSKKIIKVDSLSRIEGEAAFIIEFGADGYENLKLKIFEAPRFFEAFLKGRNCQDVIDFTARICGICPVAYQMSAVHAIEKIFRIEIPESIIKLRRLLYCGEWIESHGLHIYLLHGPDFYDLPDAWSSKTYIEILKKGLKFKRAGNSIIKAIGGRSIHPVNVRVGGFYSIPRKEELLKLLPELENLFEDSLRMIRWASELRFNIKEKEYEFISLGKAGEYPMNYGSVVTSSGREMEMEEFMNSIKEFQKPYSTALFSGLRGKDDLRTYIVGPLSRINLNYELLPDVIKDVIKVSGIKFPLKNIKLSIIARSIELAYCIYEAIRLIKSYEEPERPFIDYEPVAGRATWITEAPRGMLIHSYEFDEKGLVKEAVLIPPTSQNLYHMEEELRDFIRESHDRAPEFIRKECEKIIRSYDPCISCSVHLVNLIK